jgi:fructokinase
VWQGRTPHLPPAPSTQPTARRAGTPTNGARVTTDEGPPHPRVVVAGEALVDLVPEGELLRPVPAGSPVNVAVGLGRLGVPTAYAGTLSTDGFGEALATRLAEAAVDLTLVTAVEVPTTLAVVHLDADRRASYGFYLAATSATVFDRDALPVLPDGAALHVSFGAVGPTQHPAGDTLVALLRAEAGHRLLSLDPNVRPSAIGDLAATVARYEDAVAVCDVVKVSDEDLGLLHPDEDPLAVASRWADAGPALVVVTRGPDGAVAFAGEHHLEVPGLDVEVVDTVGAGDAFTSGLLARLDADGLLRRPALRSAPPSALQPALEHAVRVAAATCTRAGADPPSAADLPA